jgi:glycosyltransferase involved in cell wall biosynthesis
MKISVVVRTYNRPDLLKLALTSISLQTHKDWELFIFDDGALDDTYRIFQSFKDKHKRNDVYYITSSTPYDMFRKSWIYAPKLATGEVLIRLDDDDMLRKNTLERISMIYEDTPELDFTLGSYALFNDIDGVTDIELLKNIYEIETTVHAWAPYTIPNNRPWHDPWTWYENYYDRPMYYTSLIHCSKANIRMVYHLYTMRISSVLKVMGDIQVTSTHVDDLEFFGQLDYKGLGYNMLKSVFSYVRSDNMDKITYHSNIKGETLADEVFRIRDEVDEKRPSGFTSRIVGIRPELHHENCTKDDIQNEFKEYYKSIKFISNHTFDSKILNK